MILLILCILFGIASAAGYVMDKADEAKEHTWICTFRSLLAAVSFACLMLFIFWCMFFNEDAVLRNHTPRSVPEWEHPDKFRIEGLQDRTPRQEEPETILPDAYRKKEVFHPISTVEMSGDSVVWLKLNETDKKGASRKYYLFAMTNGKERFIIKTDTASVRFVEDKRPYVQVTKKWRVKDYPIVGRKALPDIVTYIISPPHNTLWLEFSEKNQ